VKNSGAAGPQPAEQAPHAAAGVEQRLRAVRAFRQQREGFAAVARLLRPATGKLPRARPR
jgi:hypothetical protein